MSVSKEDVVWCYQNLLGRDPESSEAVDVHLKTWPNFKQMILSFIASSEFLAPRPNVSLPVVSPVMSLLPPVLPKLEIDVNASSRELGKCAAKIKAAWEHMGDEKAHFSVLSNDDYMPDKLDDSIDFFWRSGEIEAAQAIRALDLYGSGNLAKKVCVEYGCGVGRVTVNLAKHFKQVHAYDISRNHLEHALARAKEVAANNIEFHECANDFRVALERCDFFYSVIVLQHNPPPVIMELIRIALTALKPGGIAMFQVPTHINDYRFDLKVWLATDHAPDMQMHCVPQDAVLDLITKTNCCLLGLREDGCTGAPDKIISNTFFCQKR